jgi:hypothetical protein
MKMIDCVGMMKSVIRGVAADLVVMIRNQQQDIVTIINFFLRVTLMRIVEVISVDHVKMVDAIITIIKNVPVTMIVMDVV